MTTQLSFILMGIAFLVSTFAYPFVLAFARKHNFVDNPSARKLQRVPVPVMGGTVVFIGFIVAVAVGMIIVPNTNVLIAMALLFVMYAIGVWDDLRDISPSFRFVMELLIVWLMILLLGIEINDLHGLWGVTDIPDVVSVPLSLVAGVGIMNAINLIDGVDGFCSTFCAMACAMFAVIFYLVGDMAMYTMALIGIGAVIPFFFHNVFGKTSKMFMGDGGSLMLGTLLAMFMFRTLSADAPSAVFEDMGLCLPALALAILAVPVFDTLKVMIFRVVRKQSPFHPDKTHLHHLFIEMNFSHLFTSGIIVLANFVIVLVLLASWQLGASMDLQLYIVVFTALLFTWGFYFFMEWHHKQNDGDGTAFWQRASNRDNGQSLTSSALWKFIRKIVDSRFFGARFVKEDASEPAKLVISEMGSELRPDPRLDARPDPRVDSREDLHRDSRDNED